MEDPASQAELIETRLRVGSWNLWWRFGNWEERLPVAVEVLRAAELDVVGLQEVWVDEATGASSASVIAEALGWHHVAAAHLVLDGIGMGNAVVSRWPISSHEVRALPPGSQPSEERLVLRADVDGPRGPLQVFCTHLNWRMDHSAVRQEQVRFIAEWVASSRPRTYPPIVVGDFNAEPQSAEIQMLTGHREVAVDGVVLMDTWQAAHPTEPGFTWTNRNPYAASQLEWDRRIDYVFVGWPKAGGAGNPVAARLLGHEPHAAGIWGSDHLGIAADLRY